MLYRIQPRLWEQTLLGEGEPVLTCRSTLPELSALEAPAQRRINRYYAHAQERFQRWCRQSLFPALDRRRRSARERSRPFEPASVCLDFEDLTPEGADVLTLRLRLSGDGAPCVCSTLTWDLRDGLPAAGKG